MVAGVTTYSVSTSPRRAPAAAAIALSLALGLAAALQLYWTLGGEWGLAAALGEEDVESTAGLRVASAVIALLLAVAAAGVLARVGLWRLPLPRRLLAVGPWLLAAALLLVAATNAVGRTSLERFGLAPLALALALLAVVVARSERHG